MPGEGPSGERDGFAGWLVFDRFGGGYLAVREAGGEHVEGGSLAELEAVVVVADAARAWRQAGW